MLNPIEKFKVTILHLNRVWNHWCVLTLAECAITNSENTIRIKYSPRILLDNLENHKKNQKFNSRSSEKLVLPKFILASLDFISILLLDIMARSSAPCSLKQFLLLPAPQGYSLRWAELKNMSTTPTYFNFYCTEKSSAKLHVMCFWNPYYGVFCVFQTHIAVFLILFSVFFKHLKTLDLDNFGDKT